MRTFPRTVAIAAAVAIGLLAVSVPDQGQWTAPAEALPNRPPSTGDLFERVYTDVSRVEPGANVTITAELRNDTGSSWTGAIDLTVTHLEATVHTATSAQLSLDADETATVTFDWTTPGTDFVGYHAGVSATGIDYHATGIEVSSSPLRYPRYGYLSDFPTSRSAAESQELITELARDYNINMVQFYDWMWRHEKLLKRDQQGAVEETWTDLFDRTLSWQTIQNDIQAVHSAGGAAMAYAMAYAAREGYEQMWGVDPDWGMYSDTGGQSQLNVDFNNGKYLWLFNPASTDWQDWMIAEYEDAINTAGFDGIHIDQMGQRDNVHDIDGWPMSIPATFPQLLQEVKERLLANDPDRSAITFNIVDGTVDGWAASEVSTYAPTDLDYSEIWWLSDTYGQLRDYIESVRENSGGKPLVLAGYANYDENIGPRSEAEDATLSGVGTNTNHAGYTGTGFVDGFDTVGDSITWTVNFPEDGDYSLVFRYGNDTGQEATRTVYIDGVPVGKVQFHDQDSWDTWVHDAYLHDVIDSGTRTVTLSYDADDTGAINVDSLTIGTFEEHSVRLADAAIAASGATRIELGDDNHMLAHEYYPNTSKSMRNSLKTAMREHYSFITAYANLLFDPDVVPADQGNQWLKLTTGPALSGNGAANSIWQQVKRTTGYDVIHLINLVGNDDQWRWSSNAPQQHSNLGVRYYPGPDATVSGVYLASPDIEHGASTELAYTTGSDEHGTYVEFTVPSLEYWDMIYVDRDVTAPASGIYEAEEAILSGTGANSNHAGYTGSGFVDQFGDTDDSVSFTVTVPDDDSYTLRFRYANATGAIATRGLHVDGRKVAEVEFGNRYAWDTWDTVERSVQLSPGVHQIVLRQGASHTGAINLDHLEVIGATGSSATSVTSVWMNNWDDMLAMHMASKLHPADTNQMYGPRLAELRYAGDWPTNQIVDATGYFRDETASVSYTSVNPFDSEGWFEDDGSLTVRYLNYDGDAPPVEITKRYAMVPNEQFLVVEYEFENLTGSTRTFNMLEQVHLNNKTWGSGSVGWQEGWYDGSRNTLGTDMSQTGQFYLQLGAFEAMDSYQVGDDTNTDPGHSESSPWHQFDANGTLANNANLWAQDLSVGFQEEITLPAYGSDTVAFYYTIGATKAEAEAASDVARAQTPAHWFTQTGAAYDSWLAGGTTVQLDDDGVEEAYRRSLVINKQSRQPEFGNWPAATNPAYEFKVWVRDSAVTAMAMDAAGFHDEAGAYWQWMASVQKPDGTFYNNYSSWYPNQPIPFVEPEQDDLGLFIIGVYRHYEALDAIDPVQADAFLDSVWSAVTASADFIETNIEPSGLGPADSSIWEEQIEYNTFTQVLYVHGLHAASLLAGERGEPALESTYLAGAQTIRDAITGSFRDTPRGLWNDSGRYFNRAVNSDGTPRLTVDASSNLAWVFGLVAADDDRARDHRIKVLSRLTHDGFGIARYEGDEFYHASPYSPGGQYEAGANEPVWPQMSMYAAMQEVWSGANDQAFDRLQWYASRSGQGYVTLGEAVDRTTGQPLVSTMIEPVTGAWFQLAVLTYLGQTDTRFPPLS